MSVVDGLVVSLVVDDFFVLTSEVVGGSVDVINVVVSCGVMVVVAVVDDVVVVVFLQTLQVFGQLRLTLANLGHAYLTYAL